jgi:serine phosphatase RsbU (regulator of sigma subunit)
MLVHVRALFRQAVRETHEPREIVARLAEAVRMDTGGVPFLTCIVIRLDEKSGCLTSTNAGHPPAIVIGATSRRMTVGGPPAGLLARVSYEQEAVRLHSGDRVIFVTDGISERVDLDAAVADLDCHATAQTLCTSVFQLSEGRNAAPPTDGWDDDRTVVVLAMD